MDNERHGLGGETVSAESQCMLADYIHAADDGKEIELQVVGLVRCVRVLEMHKAVVPGGFESRFIR